MRRFARGFVVASAVLCAAPSLRALSAVGGEELPAVGSAGGPSRALSAGEAERWLAGRESFSREHDAREGLGAPGFNAQSCAFCHKEPALGGAGGPEVDVLSLRGRNHYDPGEVAGNQLERMHEVRKSLTTPEASPFKAEALARMFDVRQTPSLLGLGLIDTIPAEEILRNEDPKDANQDGVHGIASRIAVNGATEIGRFGWKAETPRLSDFVCRALGGELGLTAPDQGRGFGLHEDGDDVLDPEASQQSLDDLAFFVSNLARPPREAVADAGPVERGAQLFERLACSACHVPVLHGSEGPVELYSDLLLHELEKPVKARARIHARPANVGKSVAARSETQVPEGAEGLFRTAPLWGVAKTAPYLHDGRAQTLSEAILAHGLEAAFARDGFAALEAQDQQALLAFLASL